jgi:integrase/recombinase XerD
MLMPSIDSYLAFRRALGRDMKNEAYLLRSFARFAFERKDTHVRTQTAIEWAADAPSPGQRARRLRTVARFVQHIRAEDPRHEVPPVEVFAHHYQRPLPQIYSQGEIVRLLDEASRLGPRGSLRPHTFKTLLGLLASTGLRVSEALALRFGDITGDGLVIRKTKFHKSRLVPLHSTTETVLQRYLELRRSASDTCDFIFISHTGGRLSYSAVHDTFVRLARRVELPSGPGKRGPQIHTLRHTFAVRALERSPEGNSIGRHLLALSTYLGHANVAGTYWYLQSTPALTQRISDACEAFLRGDAR